MNLEANENSGLAGSRQRTFSNASQPSEQSFKQNFPLTTSDSGLYTCSSDNSDCSLPIESDNEFPIRSNNTTVLQDQRLQFALQDVSKLHSQLERLAKSEQWYKQELRHQKTIRLDDLERIYTQERKFIQENQRLQKECVRLYEKCNELEKEFEKQFQDSQEYRIQHFAEQDGSEESQQEFEKEQHLVLIKDQQQLIAVLRKQKRSLLDDLKSLTVEKDAKILELQRVLADLEFDNKLITKKCSHFAKERTNLESVLKESEQKLSQAQEEKIKLQKSIVELKSQLTIQQQLLKIKENEIEHIQQHYTDKIQHEQNLDQVHELSMKYQEEINVKTLEIINLKEKLLGMQHELEEMKDLQQQSELQQREIDQLGFALQANRLELQELKTTEKHKNQQLDELHTTMDQLIKDKESVYKTNLEQQNDILRLKKALKSTQDQYEKILEIYKQTQFKLELLELEEGKLKFQNDKHLQEILNLRDKLKEYLEQTTCLSKKIQCLEMELEKVLKENGQLKQEAELNHKTVNEIHDNVNKGEAHQEKLLPKIGAIKEEDLCCRISNKKLVDQDFLQFQQCCEQLQKNLDIIIEQKRHFENPPQKLNVQKETDEFPLNQNSQEFLEPDSDFENLYLQGRKLQKNLDTLNTFLKERHNLLGHINILKNSNEGLEELVNENEVLKQKLHAAELEALTLQTKQNINERTQKYIQMQDNLEHHEAEVSKLQIRLLENDAKLYKLERKLKELEGVDEKLAALNEQNAHLKHELKKEKAISTDLKTKMLEESEKLKQLSESLEELLLKPKPTQNKQTQCSLTDDCMEETSEVKNLKEIVVLLQQEQQHFLDKEASKKEERLQLLHQMMDFQNNKIQNLQQHQKDWEDILTTMNNAYSFEEQTRKELELKRMELEELNQVFAEQNEELRKLEEFTKLLEIKRHQEKEQLKQTFQQEINVMKEHLQDCQKEIEHQKTINQQLTKSSDRFQHDMNEDFATEIASYKKEIRELKSKVNRIMEEKEELVERCKELQNQTKDFEDNKRQAILMPDFTLIKAMNSSAHNSVEDLKSLKENVCEDQIRILTKVLEAEYQRKMLRYDEHIHSLLSNLKCLKKSLKINEQKTALLSEEQLRTKGELKDLQNSKRSLVEMRLKYEQSQNTIQELKNTLASERKKFELSDLGKSCHHSASYEVSNLIDDYKKLIQQSAIATKRSSTSAILDLIQRSNQCVPNFQKLETSVDDLRTELQNFLTSYSHRMPATSLIATASISVPPSLLDELRAASEGF